MDSEITEKNQPKMSHGQEAPSFIRWESSLRWTLPSFLSHLGNDPDHGQQRIARRSGSLLLLPPAQMIMFPAAVSNFIHGEVSFSSAPQTLVKIASCTAQLHTARRCVCGYLQKEPFWGGLFIHLLCTQKVFSPS